MGQKETGARGESAAQGGGDGDIYSARTTQPCPCKLWNQMVCSFTSRCHANRCKQPHVGGDQCVSSGRHQGEEISAPSPPPPPPPPSLSHPPPSPHPPSLLFTVFVRSLPHSKLVSCTTFRCTVRISLFPQWFILLLFVNIVAVFIVASAVSFASLLLQLLPLSSLLLLFSSLWSSLELPLSWTFLSSSLPSDVVSRCSVHWLVSAATCVG